MSAQIRQLDALLAAGTGEAADELVDAWYRGNQPVFTGARPHPLAATIVAGGVPFSEAYSADYKERKFQVSTSVRGLETYLAWRREASRKVIALIRDEAADAFNAVSPQSPCDRLAMLKLTSAGFAPVYRRIAPLLMRYRSRDPAEHARDHGLAEPDLLARSYVLTLDNTAAAVAGVAEVASIRNEMIVMLAAALVPPLAGEAVAGRVLPPQRGWPRLSSSGPW